MKSLKAISLILIASTVAATAAPKFAMVRVKDIHASLPSSAALQEQVKKERDEIMRDPRADELRTIISELQTLHGQLSDKTKPLDEASSKTLTRKYQFKSQEMLALQQDFESFQSEQEMIINKRMVASMRESLDRIVEVSAKVAKQRGYDLLFDSSGNTNSGVPFVLSSKDAPDITEEVQAAMNKHEMALTAASKKGGAAK
jgi:Skp family chaperone for outer membrane proteins